MNAAEAKRILEKPKFGDAKHIEAVKVLEDESEAGYLRTFLHGKQVRCWCCAGSRFLSCDVGCFHAHPCNTCNGAVKLTLGKDYLKSADLHTLRELSAEVKAGKSD